MRDVYYGNVRRKRVRTAVRVLFFVAVLALALWALGCLTPHNCNVPVSKMSKECIDLLFP